MPLDAKSFDLRCPSDLEVLPIWRFGFRNLQTGVSFQIEAFNIQRHGPSMLKVSKSKSWGPKTLNLKLLTSWSHAPGE